MASEVIGTAIASERPPANPEAQRLESLWAGEFGDQYVERNAAAAAGRGSFWRDFLSRWPVSTALEVGCNVGANLEHVAADVSPRGVWGVDVNETALARLRSMHPQVNAGWATARDLPFRDRRFELCFTVGVLIHQPHATLPLVMAEIVRCSGRYVLCAEYEDEEVVEVPYRGQEGALFRRPYGRLYQELFPDLLLVDSGFLSREETAFDDTTWHLFERT